MVKGTFWIEERADGRVSIGIEDYDVEFFGGMDHEMIYTLDTENLRLFIEKLSETSGKQPGRVRPVFRKKNISSLKQLIEDEFGPHLDKKSISLWMDMKGIEYEFFSWTS